MNWIDVFTRNVYFCAIIESSEFFRKNKGMEIYGYCIMHSHIHLIFRSSNSDPSGLIRDLKGFTSKKIVPQIEENLEEMRAEKNECFGCLQELQIKNSNVSKRQFWQQNNHPIEIWSLKVLNRS